MPEPPAPGRATEIAEGVLWARLPLPFRPDHLNVYLLDDGDGWTLVDTGLDTAAGARRPGRRSSPGRSRARPVRRVILTHHHPDHVGLAGWFQARGAELWATRTAWLTARMLTLDVQPLPSAETLAFWRGAGMAPALLAERAEARPFNFADVVAPMPLGFRRIAQGEEIAAGGRRWRVEIGHGHAPEQATLWGVGHDLVLAGDQILPGITPNLGVYATEPDADPVGDWIASSARLRALADASATWRCPGTGCRSAACRRGSPSTAPTRRRRWRGSARTWRRRGGRASASSRSTAGGSARRNTGWRSPRRWAT